MSDSLARTSSPVLPSAAVPDEFRHVSNIDQTVHPSQSKHTLPMERRAQRRYEMRLRIAASVPALESFSTYFGETRDLSSKGFRFVLPHAIQPGTAAYFSIELPAQTGGVLICGDARVKRLTQCHDQGFEITAVIQKYRICRTETA